MKEVFALSAAISLLIPLHPARSQTLTDWKDFLIGIKGDTLVIKDYYDMGNVGNSLYWVMTLDTCAPAGRVYELEAGGYYPLSSTPITKRKTVIVGADNRMLVRNGDTTSAPPLVCGGEWNGTWNTGGITVRHDLTVKNCILTPNASADQQGWCYAYADSPNVHMIFDNCLFEHTRWVFVDIGPTGENCSVAFSNCYFVNMNGQPCRRSAGVFDSFANVDTLLIENCTHIMAAGTLYRFRAYSDLEQSKPVRFKRIIVNHNTFVNCAGYVFMNPGYQSSVSLTSNLFVNCNVQPYPAIHSIDPGEQDPDWLPMGLVNVYPNGAEQKFVCLNNLAWWDPSLENMESILDSNHVNGVTNWRSQRIFMNSRTASMFSDDAGYPYLTTDAWETKLPALTNPMDLLTVQLANLKAHALAIVDTLSTDMCPDWRVHSAAFLNPDWPIPVDLSYSDTDILTGGLGGFPLGDMNWFPTIKAQWWNQRAAEYAKIDIWLIHSGEVAEENPLPSGFKLEQNYPNPFNPRTIIKYTVGGARDGGRGTSDVRLVVYDLLGREVAMLVNERKAPGSYEVAFSAAGGFASGGDGRPLAGGVYFYRLTAPPFVKTRAMLLLK